MSKRNEHSITNEPMYQGSPSQTPDSIAEEPVYHAPPPLTQDEQRALHTVWDEPALRASGTAFPTDAYTYSRWYAERLTATSIAQSWGAILFLALCGGPFAVLGTFATVFTEGRTGGSLVIIVIGPALEEMMKIGAALIVLENRPYLFRNAFQVILCAAMAGLMFAVVENLLYIYVYNPDGTASFRLWRWTVCTAMHTGTSTIAGLGLLHMWRQAAAPSDTGLGWEYQRPQAHHAYPYIVAAVLIHGGYNAFAMVLDIATDWM